MTFHTVYSTNNLGISLDDLPFLFSIGGVATIVLSPLIGQLSDQFGKLKIFIIGTGLTIAMVAIYSNLGKVPFGVIVLLHTLLFIGINIRMITSTALATVLPDQSDRGAFMTLDASFQQIAGGVAATAAGVIVYQTSDEMVNGYPTLGLVVIGAMVITVGLMYSIHLMVSRKSG